MLFVPFLFGALVAGGDLWPRVLLGVSMTLVFIGRESFLAWRRARVHGRDPGNAGRLMVVYFGFAVLTGLPLILFYRLPGMIPVGLAAGLLLLWNGQQAAKREERSIVTEVAGIAGLMLAGPAAYYAGAGHWDATALWIWGLAAAYFAGSVFYVKMRVVSAHAKAPEPVIRARTQCAVYHAALAVAVATLVSAGRLNPLIVIAYTPVILRALLHWVRPPKQINLRQVGYLEVAYSLVFLVCGILALRGGG